MDRNRAVEFARTKPRPTWPQVTALEPDLGRLLAEAEAVRDDCGESFCANAVWYGYGPFAGRGFKDRLLGLVGWFARKSDPALRNSAAYAVAYRRIYEALPPCRNCVCF